MECSEILEMLKFGERINLECKKAEPQIAKFCLGNIFFFC